MEKLQKCVNFILTVLVFFCDQLYPQDLANAMGLNRNQILVPTFIVCCETKKELCIYFEPLYSHDLVTFKLHMQQLQTIKTRVSHTLLFTFVIMTH
jgi:hypothetical protein